MIRIGLAGWGDHAELYPAGTSAGDRLRVYGGHFPIVEVDSSFYAVQAPKTYAKWAEETPPQFGFIVKAYQGMTGHLRGKSPFADMDEMFQAFRASIQPLQEAGKLKAVLFQYPPWFDCTRRSVEQLWEAKERMGKLPLALEFRHQSWFSPDMRKRTLAFMEREGWIHSICDEPQVSPGSVPTVLQPTDPRLTIVRFHGRNAAGWQSSGAPNWRDVRYLYRYSEEELREWSDKLRTLLGSTAEVAVIFNNNSGGDAAANAKQLMRLMDIDYDGLAPRQLDLFS